MWGALATSSPCAVEQGAGEVEAFLDIDRMGGVAQGIAHFLGYRHEQPIEDFQAGRIGAFAVDLFPRQG